MPNPANPKKGPAGTTGIIPRVRLTLLAGGAAGNLTLTGIKVNEDYIVSVVAFGLTEGTPNTFSGIADLTQEFNITADNTINNSGGTSSAAKLVLVHWYDADYGEKTSVVRN